MFWLAAVLAALAFACFVVQGFWPERPRKFSLVGIGLALLTAAWAAQVIFVGGSRLVVR